VVEYAEKVRRAVSTAALLLLFPCCLTCFLQGCGGVEVAGVPEPLKTLIRCLQPLYACRDVVEYAEKVRRAVRTAAVLLLTPVHHHHHETPVITLLLFEMLTAGMW
jgi:hypothetical protein